MYKGNIGKERNGKLIVIARKNRIIQNKFAISCEIIASDFNGIWASAVLIIIVLDEIELS